MLSCKARYRRQVFPPHLTTRMQRRAPYFIQKLQSGEPGSRSVCPFLRMQALRPARSLPPPSPFILASAPPPLPFDLCLLEGPECCREE